MLNICVSCRWVREIRVVSGLTIEAIRLIVDVLLLVPYKSVSA